jgi:hypothetical protein
MMWAETTSVCSKKMKKGESFQFSEVSSFHIPDVAKCSRSITEHKKISSSEQFQIADVTSVATHHGNSGQPTKNNASQMHSI